MIRALPTLIALALGAMLLRAGEAGAQYACSVTAPGTINFLAYNPASGSPAVGSTTTTLTCTHLSGGVQRIDWTMVLSNGASGDCNARTLAGPSGTLGYNIYRNTFAGGVWGNAGCATFPSGQLTVGPGAGNSTRSTTQTLFGQIPVGQYVPAGTYTDTLTITY
jgi:spore coat protein U-like protein